MKLASVRDSTKAALAAQLEQLRGHSLQEHRREGGARRVAGFAGCCARSAVMARQSSRRSKSKPRGSSTWPKPCINNSQEQEPKARVRIVSVLGSLGPYGKKC